MLHQLRVWFTKNSLNSIILDKANSAFRIKYKQPAARWNIPPEKIDEDIYIVTICHGSTIPPERSWWHVNNKTGEVIELEYDRAKQLINIPLWR